VVGTTVNQSDLAMFIVNTSCITVIEQQCALLPSSSFGFADCRYSGAVAQIAYAELLCIAYLRSTVVRYDTAEEFNVD